MNGRKVFNFAMFEVPKQLHALCDKAGISIDQFDRIFVHQGSAAIVDAIIRKLSLSDTVVPKCLESTGNTVSSSIPLAIEREWGDETLRTIAISGFGVGLSWASAILYRQNSTSSSEA
jgi:3-oxoacyl-[acyl-carrier-protein] synthase-3